ncbi:MAG: hypothetical protein QE263_03970 [Vampirovibrionales bacterium]|nr:hypothetical protein [Vampirovibrionales bacterium]
MWVELRFNTATLLQLKSFFSMQLTANRFSRPIISPTPIKLRFPSSPPLTFGHKEDSIGQKAVHAAGHVGICAIASVIGHNFFGETAHSIANYLSEAPWFEAVSHGFSTIGHWITPETAEHVCKHGSSEGSSIANTVAHIGVECVGPTAALETGLILASEAKKATTSLLGPKKSTQA